MLFAIDVGNTNITVGIFDKAELIDTFRMTTGISRTSDEYGMYFADWLNLHGMKISDIHAVIIANGRYCAEN